MYVEPLYVIVLNATVKLTEPTTNFVEQRVLKESALRFKLTLLVFNRRFWCRFDRFRKKNLRKMGISGLRSDLYRQKQIHRINIADEVKKW